MLCADNYTLASGVGIDEIQLVSFDKALFNAGVSDYNFVRVSSILPPGCVEFPKVTAKPGSIIFSAYASRSIKGNGFLASAIGVGIPINPKEVGVIMEFSGECDVEFADMTVREMVTRSMKLRSIGLQEIKTTSIGTSTCDDEFTTVISALVMW